MGIKVGLELGWGKQKRDWGGVGVGWSGAAMGKMWGWIWGGEGGTDRGRVRVELGWRGVGQAATFVM